MRKIDSEWCRHAVTVAHHPIAFVDPDSKFVAVNAAFERLVGYSSAELKGRTWMSITHPEDVGGDLIAADSVQSGELNYTTQKRYITKARESVKVAITVWRYPIGVETMKGFTVEAISEDSASRLDKIHAEHVAEIQQIKQRLDQHDQFWCAVNTVRDVVMKWLPLLVALGGLIAWVANQH